MFKKLGSFASLAVLALSMLMTGCNGGVSVGVDVYDPYPYYDGYVWYVVHDPYYDPYYNPYCVYCYSDDGTVSQKDLAKLTAQQQAVVVERSAEKLQANLGLSAERSTQLAKLAIQMGKTPKSSLTDRDMDNFSTAILGSTSAELKSAFIRNAAGDSSKLDQLIDRAAAVNGIGPEHAREIMKMMN